MKHTIESTELPHRLPIAIGGTDLTPTHWKVKTTDLEPQPYFGEGFRQDIRRDPEPHETELTITFSGDQSSLVREILNAIISEQND